MSNSLLQSTFVVSAMTMVSRILGFVRDIVLAQTFGAGGPTDAFFVAFRIPNLLRRLSAEGAFALAFVPVFGEYKARRPNELRELIDRVSGTLAVVLLALTLGGVVAAPVLIMLFAPGFDPQGDKFAMSVAMLRLTFPYVFFISLVAAAAGVLNSFGRFAVPAFTPVLLNICLIGAATVVAPRLEQPIMALAGGVFFAGIAQLLFQLPALKRIGMLPRPRWGWRHSGVQKIITLMVPAIIGSSAAQINLLINTVLASFLVTGSVSWLYYTDRLVEFPLGVFAVAISTVILPRLSREFSEADSRFAATLDWGLKCVLIVGIPATVALIILASPLLTTFFYYGEFSLNDVQMTARSLTAYAFGLLGFMLVKVLAPGFYAQQDSRTPVRIGLIAIATNIGLNLLLIGPLAHVGLALAAALASYVNAGLLLLLLYRKNIYRSSPGVGVFALKGLLAALLMGGILWLLREFLSDFATLAVTGRMLNLALLVITGGVSYAIILLLLGVRPRQLYL